MQFYLYLRDDEVLIFFLRFLLSEVSVQCLMSLKSCQEIYTTPAPANYIL